MKTNEILYKVIGTIKAMSCHSFLHIIKMIFLCFLTEYASRGSLYEYLSSIESEQMDIRQILTWAVEIAKGRKHPRSLCCSCDRSADGWSAGSYLLCYQPLLEVVNQPSIHFPSVLTQYRVSVSLDMQTPHAGPRIPTGPTTLKVWGQTSPLPSYKCKTNY